MSNVESTAGAAAPGASTGAVAGGAASPGATGATKRKQKAAPQPKDPATLTPEPFDLIVIGSGPAGEKGAAQAAYFGKRVAVVEREEKLGGACVNTGTLPSKCLRESALYMSGLRATGIKGVKVSIAKNVSVEDLMAHKEFVCTTEIERIERNLSRHGILLVKGAAEFLEKETVLVRSKTGDDRKLTAPVILVATGTRPFRPADIPFDHEAVWDSDEILDMDRVPKTLIVVGAGVIGCEYAAMFAALGVKVTLVEPRERILPFIDEEVSDSLVVSFRALGMDMRLGQPVTSVKVEAGEVRAALKDGSLLQAERLLYAAGRMGNTDTLALDRVGLQADKRGQLQVNEHYETKVKGIYAVGDVIGFPALASTGMDQGRVAMCHAFDLKYKTALARLLPYGIYTIPEVSMVGDTEQDVKKRGEEYEIGRAFYRDNARGRMLGDQQGFVKIIFRPADKKLLGVHVVGERAADLVHVGLTVMQFGGSIDAFIDAVYNYPTMSECYKYAAYDGLGRLAKRRAKEAQAAAGAIQGTPTPDGAMVAAKAGAEGKAGA